jgi:hypothetical protein
VNDDGAVGVFRSRNVDVKPARPATVLALVLDAQRLAGRVSDGAVFYIQPGRPALSGVVMERQIAIDPVPLTLEADGELLDNVERAIGIDGEQRVVIPNANGTLLRLRVSGECAGKDPGEEECASNNGRRCVARSFCSTTATPCGQ